MKNIQKTELTKIIEENDEFRVDAPRLHSDCAFNDLEASFVDSLEKDEHGEATFEFDLFSWLIMSSLNWPTEKRYFVWQFNFQHYLFPAHTDGCGFLKPKLNGGEGFGHKFAVEQLKGTGDTWVFVVAEVPGTNRSIGIKFCVRTGDVWCMEDDGRYKFMHAVAAPYPSGVHKVNCLDC